LEEGGVTSVAFDASGRLAAGYSRSGVFGVNGVVLFDVRGERVGPAPLKVKEDRVRSVAFDASGRLAAGYGFVSVGGVVLFVDPASPRRKAERLANRNFTWKEWTQYFPGSPYRRTIRSRPWPDDLPEDERVRGEAAERQPVESRDAT
jgi:hypothetical protein